SGPRNRRRWIPDGRVRPPHARRHQGLRASRDERAHGAVRAVRERLVPDGGRRRGRGAGKGRGWPGGLPAVELIARTETMTTADPAARIAELRSLVRHHEERYYIHNDPEISDEEF